MNPTLCPSTLHRAILPPYQHYLRAGISHRGRLVHFPPNQDVPLASYSEHFHKSTDAQRISCYTRLSRALQISKNMLSGTAMTQAEKKKKHLKTKMFWVDQRTNFDISISLPKAFPTVSNFLFVRWNEPYYF